MAEPRPFASPRNGKSLHRRRTEGDAATGPGMSGKERSWSRSNSGSRIGETYESPITPRKSTNSIANEGGGKIMSADRPRSGMGKSQWSRTQSSSPATRLYGNNNREESPSFEKSQGRKIFFASSPAAREDIISRRRTFKRQSIITAESPVANRDNYIDDRHEYEEKDHTDLDLRQDDEDDEDEAETPKSRNCAPTMTSSGTKSKKNTKFSSYPPRPLSSRNSSNSRLPDLTEEKSINAEDDNRTIFTEQQEARKVRLELEEMLYSQQRGSSSSMNAEKNPSNAYMDRRPSSSHQGSYHQRNHSGGPGDDDDDDQSVVSRKSHHSTMSHHYHNHQHNHQQHHIQQQHQHDDDDDDHSICSRRSIASNRLDGEVEKFRKRFISSDSPHHQRYHQAHAENAADDASQHSHELENEFESLIAKMKRDNNLLKRKYYHEKQKNQDLSYDLEIAKEEMRGLKQEIRAMDSERDELEDRMATAETKMKKMVRQKNDLEADLTGKIEELEEKLQKSESSAQSLKDTMEEAAKLSEGKVVSKEMLHTKLSDELKKENEKLRMDIKELESQLHDAEIQAARVQALETLLEQQADLKNTQQSGDDATVGTQHLLERKLDIAGSKVVTLEKALSIKERTVQALEQEIAGLKHIKKGGSSAAIDRLTAEIASLKRKLREYEAMDLQSLLKQSQSSIEDFEKEKARTEENYEERIRDLEEQLKQKQAELSGNKDAILSQLESLLGQKKSTSDQAVKNLEALLSKVTQEKLDVEDALKKLQTAHKDLQSQFESQLFQLKEARDTITTLQRDALQSQNKESLEITGYLESKIEILTKEKETARIAYQQKLDECDVKIKSLETELSMSRDKIEKLSMDLTRANNSKQGRQFGDEKEIARLSAELDSHKRKNMHLEETIYIMKTEIRELEAKEANKTMSSTQERFQIEKLKADLSESHQRRRELERKVADMQTLLGQAESVIAKTNAVAIKSVMEALKRKEHGGRSSSHSKHPQHSSNYFG